MHVRRTRTPVSFIDQAVRNARALNILRRTFKHYPAYSSDDTPFDCFETYWQTREFPVIAYDLVDTIQDGERFENERAKSAKAPPIKNDDMNIFSTFSKVTEDMLLKGEPGREMLFYPSRVKSDPSYLNYVNMQVIHTMINDYEEGGFDFEDQLNIDDYDISLIHLDEYEEDDYKALVANQTTIEKRRALKIVDDLLTDARGQRNAVSTKREHPQFFTGFQGFAPN